MHEHHLSVTRTARYFTLGPLDGAPREVWIVCHGFGQLAARFLRHFEPLDDGTRLVVAPEGLHRYYLDDLKVPAAERRVGASWMTREDRLADINDYVGYLDTLCDELFRRVPRAGTRLVALGFSQGVATVSRWIAQGTTRVDRAILWAGPFPPDVDPTAARERLGGLDLTLVLGTRDEFASEELVAQQARLLGAAGVAFRSVSFEGGHTMDAATLRALAGRS